MGVMGMGGFGVGGFVFGRQLPAPFPHHPAQPPPDLAHQVGSARPYSSTSLYVRDSIERAKVPNQFFF